MLLCFVGRSFHAAIALGQCLRQGNQPAILNGVHPVAELLDVPEVVGGEEEVFIWLVF